MKLAVRALQRLIVVVAIVAAVLAPLSVNVAYAAEGDACEVGGLPGVETAGICTAAVAPGQGLSCGPGRAFDGALCTTTCTTSNGIPGTGTSASCAPNPSPTQGQQCAGNVFYTTNNGANICVADNQSCSYDDGGTTRSGVYDDGVCGALPSAPGTPPTPPDTPSVMTPIGGAGGSPTGEQQPMCVNASPFIGGGVFVVSGTVLCYTGAGRDTQIKAYSDSGAGGGWNPFDPSEWNSLSLKDLYAGDDVTALGTLSVYGGAQIYSPDGNTGMQITDDGVLIRSQDDAGNIAGFALDPTQVAISVTDGTSTSSNTTTADGVALASTDGTSTSSLTVSGGGGIDLSAGVATGGPAININGAIGATSDAMVGVIVRGDGQGSQTAPTSGPAAWADVMLASKSYGTGGGAGSGVIVNDYGVIVQAAATGNTYNAFGSGAANAAGSHLTNVIGAGGAGSVSNFIGAAGATGTEVINEMGTGTGGGYTTNRIGNANALTSVVTQAGSSSTVVVEGALDFSTGEGDSILTNPTQQVRGGSAVAMLGTETRHATVNANGRVTVVDGTAADEASSSLYIVNGNGGTNAVVVTEQQAMLSGGVSSPTSMTLNDYGASFSNANTGGPVVVTGIADGQGPNDAVNKRQLDGGLASIAAMTGLPAPQMGKRNSFGMALGHHGSGAALALGGQSMLGDALTVKYGAAVSYSSGLTDTSASLGVGFSW